MGIPINELRLSQIYFDGKSHAALVAFGRKAFLVDEVDVWGDPCVSDDDMCVVVQVDLPVYGGATIVGRKACAFAAAVSPVDDLRA